MTPEEQDCYDALREDNDCLKQENDALAARLDEAVALLDEAEQWLGDNDDEEATARRIRAFLAKLVDKP